MTNKISRLSMNIRDALIALTFLATADSVFGVVLGSHILNGDGSTTYSYVVDNRAGPFNVAAWSLEFGFPAPDWNQLDVFSGGDVHVPNPEWFADTGTPISGQSAQDFISLTPYGDVGVGNTLWGFSFTSDFQPGTITYTEFSADGRSVSGTTVGPVNTVPEGNGPFEAISFVAIAGFAAFTRSSRNKANVITIN